MSDLFMIGGGLFLLQLTPLLYFVKEEKGVYIIYPPMLPDWVGRLDALTACFQ